MFACIDIRSITVCNGVGRKGFAMKKIAIGGMLVGLAFIIAGVFWLAYRNIAENDKPADETFVQSPVIKTDQEAPTAKQGGQDVPTKAAEGAAETTANKEIGSPPEASVAHLDLMELPSALRIPVPAGYERYGKIAYTRQGNPYRINPDWDDAIAAGDPRIHSKSLAAARATPTGPPLSHNWAEAKGASGGAINGADWSDPRTWESYRNFWGFDRALAINGSWPYRARIDNWGAPLQMFKNSSLVTRYGKQTGFRPSPEQLERYLNLERSQKRALFDGDSSAADALEREIGELIASAQGELPDLHHAQIQGVFDPYPGGSVPPEVRRERTAAAIRNLYIRLGIGHLYEFYQNPDFRKNRK